MWEALREIAQKVKERYWSLPDSFDKGLELYMGADGTPTSNIDKIAEDMILECVEGMKVPVNVLSEEAGYIDRGMDRTLVIDPIDGTFNAIPWTTVLQCFHGGRDIIDDGSRARYRSKPRYGRCL